VFAFPDLIYPPVNAISRNIGPSARGDLGAKNRNRGQGSDRKAPCRAGVSGYETGSVRVVRPQSFLHLCGRCGGQLALPGRVGGSHDIGSSIPAQVPRVTITRFDA